MNSFHDWGTGRGVAAFALGYMLVCIAMKTLALDTLSDESRQRSMWDNPARLYGLG